MNLKAPRPHGRGTTTIQLTDTRRSRRDLSVAPLRTGTSRLMARWQTSADGRPVLVWSLRETSARSLINRKRGSDA